MKSLLAHPESKACLRRLTVETAKSRVLAPGSRWCGEWPVDPPSLATPSPFSCLTGVLEDASADAPVPQPVALHRPSRPPTVRREPLVSPPAEPRPLPAPLSCPAQATREQLTAAASQSSRAPEPLTHEPLTPSSPRTPECPSPALTEAPLARTRSRAKALAEQLSALPAVAQRDRRRARSEWPRDREFARRVFPQKCAGDAIETLKRLMSGATPISAEPGAINRGAIKPNNTRPDAARPENAKPCTVEPGTATREDLERWSRPPAAPALDAPRRTAALEPSTTADSRAIVPNRQTPPHQVRRSHIESTPESPSQPAAQRAAAATAAGFPTLPDQEPVGFSTAQSAPTPDWSVAVARGLSEQLTRVFPPSGTALPPTLMPDRMLFPPSTGVTGPGQRLAIAAEDARPPDDDLPGLAEKLHRLLREDARRHGIDV